MPGRVARPGRDAEQAGDPWMRLALPGLSGTRDGWQVVSWSWTVCGAMCPKLATIMKVAPRRGRWRRLRPGGRLTGRRSRS